MKFVYPAVIEPAERGFHAYFPDLAFCEAAGETRDEAARNARDAMYGWIDAELAEDDPDLPFATPHRDISYGDGAEIRDILIHYRFNTGWDE